MSPLRRRFLLFVFIFLSSVTALLGPRESGGGELVATWHDNSSDEDGFKVERRAGTAQTYTQVAIVGANVTSYRDFGLVAGEIYCYRVLAFNATGTSPHSNESCAVAGPDIGRDLLAAVLPPSRSVQVGVGADVSATVMNLGSTPAASCGVSLVTSVPVVGLFQATDPDTNQLVGSPNTPVDIPAGGVQSFFVRLTPTQAFPPTDAQMRFGCANTNPAPITTGLNTVLLSASLTPVPDIVAWAATLNQDGLVNLLGPNGTGSFAVATLNMGAGGTITVSADTGSASLPVFVSLCETNPADGQCVSAVGSSVTTVIDANAMPTFGIFVQGKGDVAFNPAASRIFVRFRDAAALRGSTSVAVRTQ